MVFNLSENKCHVTYSTISWLEDNSFQISSLGVGIVLFGYEMAYRDPRDMTTIRQTPEKNDCIEKIID